MALCYVYDFESLSSIARRYGVSRSLVSEREEDLRRLELIDEGIAIRRRAIADHALPIRLPVAVAARLPACPLRRSRRGHRAQ
jgi:hypothetical protein